MLALHTSFGKALIIFGYIFGLFLLVAAAAVTLAVGSCWVHGKTPDGMEMDTAARFCGSILVVTFWCYSALVLGVSHLLRTAGNLRLCRILAGLLLIFIPFGTVFGLLTHIYLRNREVQRNAV